MTARATFGRKGVGDGGGDGGGGAAQSRRAAFLATERERADRAADTDVFPAPTRADLARRSVDAEPPEAPAPAKSRAVGPRSLRLAYALWLVLGIAGIHRLYLGRTASGAVQAALCAGCFAATWMQYYQAFAGLALCWIWMFVDGLKLKQMHAEATAQAEALA
jgi:TM2 domain-containing membrane protein YozV